MRISRAITALTAAGLLAATAAGAASPAAATPASGCTPSWKLVSAPSGPVWHAISGIAADSAGDAWFPAYNALGVSWAYHWDGRSLGATATVPQGPYTLRSTATGSLHLGNAGPVSFDSPADGWMIGPSILADGNDSPDWAAHWSGNRWIITPLAVSPDPASSVELDLFGASAVSPADAWAVGSSIINGLPSAIVGALIEHWDGSQWRIVPNPASSQANTVLYAITTVSATDIWAVGTQGLGTGAATPFAEHWDGTSWSVVQAPAGIIPSILTAISADSPSDAWAVGTQPEPGGSNLLTGLAEHWDGRAWSVVTGLPDLGNSALVGVYAASPADVWALVQTPTPDGHVGVDQFLHWDGSSWTTVPVPGPHEYALDYGYSAIAGTSPGNIWAAGAVYNSAAGSLEPLIAHLSCR